MRSYISTAFKGHFSSLKPPQKTLQLTRNPGGKGSLSQTDEVHQESEAELFKINRLLSVKENSSPNLLVGNNGVVYDISNTNKINGF